MKFKKKKKDSNVIEKKVLHILRWTPEWKKREYIFTKHPVVT